MRIKLILLALIILTLNPPVSRAADVTRIQDGVILEYKPSNAGDFNYPDGTDSQLVSSEDFKIDANNVSGPSAASRAFLTPLNKCILMTSDEIVDSKSLIQVGVTLEGVYTFIDPAFPVEDCKKKYARLDCPMFIDTCKYPGPDRTYRMFDVVVVTEDGNKRSRLSMNVYPPEMGGTTEISGFIAIMLKPWQATFPTAKILVNEVVVEAGKAHVEICNVERGWQASVKSIEMKILKR